MDKAGAIAILARDDFTKTKRDEIYRRVFSSTDGLVVLMDMLIHIGGVQRNTGPMRLEQANYVAGQLDAVRTIAGRAGLEPFDTSLLMLGLNQAKTHDAERVENADTVERSKSDGGGRIGGDEPLTGD